VTRPGFPDLISQLNFDGDPHIAADPWASQMGATQRIIALNDLGGGDQEGVFDIVLDGQTGIEPGRFGFDGDLLPVHPNPMSERCSIHFNVFRPARVAMHIADLNGRVLITLIDEQKSHGRYTTQWDGREASGGDASAGTYLCIFTMDGVNVKAHPVVKG
jgi:hypothetical protein